MKEKIISEVRQALKSSADKKTLESSNRFFKEGEEAKIYGVKMAEVSRIGRGFYKQIKGSSKPDELRIEAMKK